MNTRRLVTPILTLAFAGLSLGFASGCSSSEPQTQVNVPGGGAVGTGDLSGTPQPGQQWSVSDQGSGAGIGQNRPKMSDAALGPYNSGMQAFVAGDLQNAKKFFEQAT